MKNRIINTFASIGVITVIAVACSSALSEDDVIVATNVQQSENGRYAISCTISSGNNRYCYKMDTRDGSIQKINNPQ